MYFQSCYSLIVTLWRHPHHFTPPRSSSRAILSRSYLNWPPEPSQSAQMALWSPTTSTPTSPTSPIHARHVSSSFPAGPSIREKYKGRRIAQIVKLKPEFVSKYKECHAKVWPEVLKQIRDCRIEDCASFFPWNNTPSAPLALLSAEVLYPHLTGYC
jgi:hypothetical protein